MVDAVEPGGFLRLLQASRVSFLSVQEVSFTTLILGRVWLGDLAVVPAYVLSRSKEIGLHPGTD